MESPVSVGLEEEPTTPRRISWNGLSLVIEVEPGQVRAIMDGRATMYMMAPYGYIEGTRSMEEGDEIDVFMNPDSERETDKVFAVEMLKDGILEEEKYFLGYPSQERVQEMFLQHYDKEKLGPVVEMSVPDFVEHLKYNVRKPAPLYKIAGLSGDALTLAVKVRRELKKNSGPALTVSTKPEGRLTSEKLAKRISEATVWGRGHEPGDALVISKLSKSEAAALNLRISGVSIGAISEIMSVDVDELRNKMDGWGY